jgi:hypothetical protein
LRNNEKNGLSLSSAGGDYAIQNVASDNSDGNFYGGGGKNYLPLSGSNANYGF